MDGEPSPVSDAEIRHVLKDASLVLRMRKAVFLTAQHYWLDVLKRDPITEPGFMVANLGAGIAIDALPLEYALEGKSRYDLAMTIKDKPQRQLVQVTNYDRDSKSLSVGKNNPLVSLYGARPETYCQADIRHLSLDDGSVNMAWFRHPNWREITEQADREQIYQEIDRIVTPGGIYWSTHFTEEEMMVAAKLLEQTGHFNIRIQERNQFPGPQFSLHDPDTNKEFKVNYDGFILIAVKKDNLI